MIKIKKKVKKIVQLVQMYGQYFMITVLIVFFSFNAVLTLQLSTQMKMMANSSIGMNDIIPSGVPYYGQKVGVSYDNVVPSIPVLAKLDNYPAGPDKDVSWFDRYIRIGLRANCEYCCSATAMIFKNGQAACGCKHAGAMRGILSWLLVNSPEKTDDEILTEVNKWKALFFPKQTLQKAVKENINGKIDYKKILNDLQSAPDMVGGC